MVDVGYDGTTTKDCVMMEDMTTKGLAISCGDSFQTAGDDLRCALQSLGHDTDDLSILVRFGASTEIPAPVVIGNSVRAVAEHASAS